MSYPALAKYPTVAAYRALKGIERRQALALLGDAYRCATTPALQEGVFSLAMIALASIIEGYPVDVDALLEDLLTALMKGKDTEDAVRHRAQIDLRAEARRLERHRKAAQLQPTTTKATPALALPSALTLLPPKYQQVAGLLALGYEGPEIAKALNIKEGAARILIMRVRDELRVTLG